MAKTPQTKLLPKHPKRTARRDAAALRQVARDKRTPKQQLDRVIRRLRKLNQAGVNAGLATRERARLNRLIAAEKASATKN